MAQRPEILGVPNYIPWATESKVEVVVEEGKTLYLSNKSAPLEEHTNWGLKYNEPPNYREINYQFQGYSEWFQHLDERLRVGSIYPMSVNTPIEVIEEQLGGTWAYVGSEVVGSESIYYYKKTGV